MYVFVFFDIMQVKESLTENTRASFASSLSGCYLFLSLNIHFLFVT